MRKHTKIGQVLNHLETHGTLTSRESVKYYNDYRLAAKIHTLIHRDGHNITCENISFRDVNGNKSVYGKYTLHKPRGSYQMNKYGNLSRHTRQAEMELEAQDDLRIMTERNQK